MATYKYNDLGQRTRLSRYGTAADYSYDAAWRLSQLKLDFGGTAYDQTIDLTSYNPVGQIVSQTRSNDAYAWTGDANVDRGYAVNGLNQYTQSGSIVPTYDGRGNLTSAGPTVYGYNSENRLTSASAGVSLAYDPLLRLYQTVSGGVTTRMAYDGDHIIAEYDGSGTPLRHTTQPQRMISYEYSSTTKMYRQSRA